MPRFAQPYLVAALHEDLRVPTLVVVPTTEDAKSFYEQLLVWHSSRSQILLFPKPDALPYERLATDPFNEQQRLQVLTSLIASRSKSNPGSQLLLIVSSAAALVRKTTPYSHFSAASHVVKQGIEINLFDLLNRWSSMGYQRANLVETPGTMSHRGGIVDVYPPNSQLPARIEFLGNRVESIRLFDPQTQRSLKPVPSIELIPGQEAAWPSTDTLISYLTPDSLIILADPGEIEASINELDLQASQERTLLIEKGELPQDSPVSYITCPELRTKLESVKQRLVLNRWSNENSDNDPIAFMSPLNYAGQVKPFITETEDLIRKGYRVVIVSQQAARLSELFQEEDIIASPLNQIEHPPAEGSITLIQGSLPEGWIMGHDLAVFSDAEIFGFVKQPRTMKPRPAQSKDILSVSSPGDHVVHIDHGIARFIGMKKLLLDNIEREYLTLEYASGDMLYVPIDQADRVSRYVGSVGKPLSLSRLGTMEWSRAKQRVKESAKEMAQDLLDLYAVRGVAPGFAFSPDTPWQQELEASFPYTETPDQMEAVGQVKEDMEQPKPMDRLVCGDVGYGKTEIALRASFKAVMDAKQVAVLVPTTVLAQQHLATFMQRLAAFPIKVEMLSRFRSDKEQQAVIEGLKNGSVDICIGTHRLLQKDVAFKDLGLVIIDEEQRFGVAHKEFLKQLRKEVDVITLTATPIPRTLHMSLVGVRDMSTLETPPEARLPIKTYVAEYNETLIREAIVRELERSGQVFFVHNRVQSITRIAHKLRELVPEAEIAIAHGQMNEEELEKAMLDFYEGKIDVLACTTIIESGLDIPNVNTLIINEADKLGLSQLYQLRGRIGRGNNRAYAYFLYNKGKHLTPAAEKRLQTIFEASELGAGFQIAIKDLEIRGAGNLLGAEQSGHIAAVGFDLYCQLLSEAVTELKEKQSGETGAAVKASPAILPTLELPLSAYIPESYVVDLTTRLPLYRRMAKMTSVDEVQELENELKDRFGKLPAPLRNLLYLVKIKAMAAQAGVQSISKEGGHIVIRFREGTRLDPGRIGQAQHGIRAGTTQVQLDMRLLGNKWQKVLEDVVVSLAG